jgi:hypothetical protein
MAAIAQVTSPDGVQLQGFNPYYNPQGLSFPGATALIYAPTMPTTTVGQAVQSIFAQLIVMPKYLPHADQMTKYQTPYLQHWYSVDPNALDRDSLLRVAQLPSGKSGGARSGGLSKVGLALQKHGQRESSQNSLFKKYFTSQKPADLNANGLRVVTDILDNPRKTCTLRPHFDGKFLETNVVQIFEFEDLGLSQLSKGKGVQFDVVNLEFVGFLSP